MSLRVWLPLNKDPNVIVPIASFYKEGGITLTEDTNGWYKVADSSHTSGRWGIYYNFPVEPNTNYTLRVYSKSGGSASTSIGIQSYTHNSSWPPVRDTNTTTTEKLTTYNWTTGENDTVARIYLAIGCTSTVANNYVFYKAPEVLKEPVNQGLDKIASIILENTNSYINNGKVGNYSLALNKLQTILPQSSCMSGAKKISYAFWIKVNSTWSTNWLDGIRWYSTDGSTISYGRQEFYTNCTKIGTWFPGDSISNVDFTPNVWTHLAGTFDYDTGHAAFYVNGELMGEKDTLSTSYYCRGDFYIGDNGVDIVENDVRIYDHCLSPMEVKELSKGLVLHYPLNRNGMGQDNLILQSTYSNDPWKSAMIERSVIHEGKESMLFWVNTLYNKTERGTTPVFPGITFEANTQYTLSWNWRDDYRTDGKTTAMYFVMRYSDGSTSEIASTATCKTKWERKIMISTAGKTLSSITTTYGSGSAMYITDLKLEKGANENPVYSLSSSELSALEYDCSGFCNNGTRTGTFDWTSDTPKYAVSTKIIPNSNIQFTPMLTGAYSWTVAAWIKSTAVNGDGRAWFSVEQGTYWQVTCYSNLLSMRDNSIGGTGTRKNYSFGTIAANTWIHLVATYDNGTLKLYNNGVLQNTNTVGGTYLNAMNNGRWGSVVQDGYYWNGQISDARIYATALSADDVKSLYLDGHHST